MPQIPNSLPTTFSVSECPICEILTPQLKIWGDGGLIGQYCFDCQHLMYNRTEYSPLATRQQKILTSLVLEQQGKGVVHIVDHIPMGIDTLWPYYSPGRSREGFKLLR